MLHVTARWILAVFLIAAGANHFISPEIYAGMMPPWLPAPDLLHRLAGVAEIAGAIGLLVPALRRLAAWGLIALMIAIFPANLHVALTGEMPGLDVAPWVLWARLPFQAVFIAWIGWVGLRRTPASAK